MNYIVLDMEWNQSFSKKSMVWEPVALYGEIIQIGAVKLDEAFQVVDTFKMGIRPRCYSKMNKRVKSLTRITNGHLRNGLPFPIALSFFRIWCGEDVVFLIWGSDDMDVLRTNMKLHEMDLVDLPQAYNLQVIFDAQIAMKGHVMALRKALALLEITPHRAHDALNDAMNTAEICRHLDLGKGMAEYESLEEKLESARENYNGPIVDQCVCERTYPNRACAIEDAAVTSFYSAHYENDVVCEMPLRQNKNKFIAKGALPTGETLFVRFKFVNAAGGKFRVTRMVYEWSDHNEAYYEMIREKREKKNLMLVESCV